MDCHSVFSKFTRFFKENSIPLESDFLVSLSGGRDSVCLFQMFYFLLKQNKINSLRAIHFNHGVRKESVNEELFVRDLCALHGVDLKVHQLNINSNANFEKVAREKRYELIEKELHPGEFCCLGHHLDDSFEWSMMRMFRSGDSDFLKGIPKVRGRFIRPLSSISRDEITQYMSHYNFKFVNDTSNELSTYDRNHLRNKIINEVKNRYPNYLQFYLSRRENHLSREDSLENKSAIELINRGDQFSILHLEGQAEKHYVEVLKREITRISDSNRGSINRELDKLIDAFNHGKKGPMQFSGHCFVWIDRPFIVVFHQDFQATSVVHHVDDISRFANRADFLRYLRSMDVLSPFISAANFTNKQLEILKNNFIPSCFIMLPRSEKVYSLGGVYKLLPIV